MLFGGVVAQRTVITMTDDIDGSEASDTVVFSLDGSTYEIDLNEAHAEDLREVLAPYVGAARRIGPPRARGGRASAHRPRSSEVVDPKAVDATAVDPRAVDPRAIRAWAESNGVEVSARGRLKAEVVEQYKAANS